MSKNSNSSGCVLSIVAGLAALAILAAFGAIFHGLEQLVKKIPWWLYIIVGAAFIYIYHARSDKE